MQVLQGQWTGAVDHSSLWQKLYVNHSLKKFFNAFRSFCVRNEIDVTPPNQITDLNIKAMNGNVSWIMVYWMLPHLDLFRTWDEGHLLWLHISRQQLVLHFLVDEPWCEVVYDLKFIFVFFLFWYKSFKL